MGVGAETRRRVVPVMIVRLFSSTCLTLILLPAIYEWVEARYLQAEVPAR
jgi:Cu/Ag efflux pump CusA